jgi:hypothetical protein
VRRSRRLVLLLSLSCGLTTACGGTGDSTRSQRPALPQFTTSDQPIVRIDAAPPIAPANVVAAIRVGERRGPGKRVARLRVDSGLKYPSTGVYRRSPE